MASQPTKTHLYLTEEDASWTQDDVRLLSTTLRREIVINHIQGKCVVVIPGIIGLNDIRLLAPSAPQFRVEHI